MRFNCYDFPVGTRPRWSADRQGAKKSTRSARRTAAILVLRDFVPTSLRLRTKSQQAGCSHSWHLAWRFCLHEQVRRARKGICPACPLPANNQAGSVWCTHSFPEERSLPAPVCRDGALFALCNRQRFDSSSDLLRASRCNRGFSPLPGDQRANILECIEELEALNPDVNAGQRVPLADGA